MGLEPMTCALRVRCSTTELPGRGRPFAAGTRRPDGNPACRPRDRRRDRAPTRHDADAHQLSSEVPIRPARRIMIGTPGTGVPATTVTMPFSDLLAFACGRSDASEERVRFSGDAALVSEALRSMGFTP